MADGSSVDFVVTRPIRRRAPAIGVSSVGKLRKVKSLQLLKTTIVPP